MKGFFTYETTDAEVEGRVWHYVTLLQDFGGLKRGDGADFAIMVVSPEGPVLRLYRGHEVIEVEFDAGERRA